MAGYIGRTPLSEAVQSRAKYTATAGQTTFSFAYQPGFIDVFLNGIKIEDTTDYAATTGTEIVLTSPATVGQVLEIIGLSTFSLVSGKHNYSATAAPAVGDDSADGYRIGSMWIDVTNDEAYRCVDDTTGAAVWIGTTLEVAEADLRYLRLAGGTLTGGIDVTGSVKLTGDIIGSTGATGDITIKSTSGNSNYSKIDIGTNLASDNGGISFYTAGTSIATSRMRISGTSGNVGIGTSSPAYNLDVNSTSNTTLRVDSPNTAKLLLENGGGGEVSRVTTKGNDTLIFDRTVGGESMRIDSSGNVGIGATSMNRLLQIQTFATTGLAHLEFRNTQAGSQIGMPANTNALSLYTGDNERMRITSTGNVGIGTSAPKAILVVGSKSKDTYSQSSNSAYGDEDPAFEIHGAAGARYAEWVHGTKYSTGGGGTHDYKYHWYGFKLPGGYSNSGTHGFLDVTCHITGRHASGSAVKQFKLTIPNEHGQGTSGGLESTYVHQVYDVTRNVGAYNTSLAVTFYYKNNVSTGNTTPGGILYMAVTSRSREPQLTVHVKYLGGTGADHNYLQKMFFLGSAGALATLQPSSISTLTTN